MTTAPCHPDRLGLMVDDVWLLAAAIEYLTPPEQADEWRTG